MGMHTAWASGSLVETCLEKYPSKRPKISENVIICQSKIEKNNEIPNEINITSLPLEILFEILSYLPCTDLYTLKKVNTFFEQLVHDPTVWRVYEVINNDMNTEDVIEELKRMPFLKKFSIDARSDSDDILRQLSLTNKNLEELSISNCTGSTSKLYLRSSYLIRILERCIRLHTIYILGSRFRGLKFFRILGNMGLRLKAASTQATCLQFRAYTKSAKHISENDRQLLSDMSLGARRWAPLHYLMMERQNVPHKILISYLYSDFLPMEIIPQTETLKLAPD
ncbi:uncharacterized protein LOC117172294 [Belonocnema kinseyi]|uniref:uncharacterized protein LOC117172294 n=1 Tax=Belonocnema kinseyi TaxID=2817044 RepID=UPI00143CCAA9|nr:uncharacterized protein LOC117172294 [Belonocnema kinseyi]